MNAATVSLGDAEGSPKSVVRQSGLTSVVAFVGVLSGLVLDLAWGRMFGVGDTSDAFALALRLPLAVTAIVMVVANQILVPTFGAWMTQLHGRERDRVSTGVLVACLGGSIALAAIFTVFAEPLMTVMAPGFADTPGKLELAAGLTRILAWYIPCVTAAEVLRCWLNANLVIGFPAAMALVLNAVAVLVIVLGPRQIEIVPIAYVAGSVVQLLAMLAAALYKGWRPGRPEFTHPEVKRTLRLFARPVAGASLNPVMRIVETFIASILPSGSATILHFGNRLAHAVGGTIVFRSIMVTVLPRLSRAYGRGDADAFRHLTRLGLRLMFYLAVPMTVLGVAVGPALTEAAFRGGKFTASAAAELGVVMALYALSFAGSGIQRSLLAPFYAMRDTKTPWRNTLYGTAANLALLPPLVLALRGSGHAIYAMPIAYSAAQYVNVAHAWWRMRRLPGLGHLPFARSFAGSLLCGLAGGIAALLVLRFAPQDPRQLPAALASVVGVGVCAVVGVRAFGARRTPKADPADPIPPPRRHDMHQALAAASEEDTHVDTIDTTPERLTAPERLNASVPAHRRQRPGDFGWQGILLALLGTAIAVYTSVGLLDGTSNLMIAVPIAAMVGLALAVVAWNDLETFVLVAIALRSSLDALKIAGPIPDPASVLGMMLLAVSALWLVSRRIRLGSRFPVSRLGASLLVFLVVAAVGVLTSARLDVSVLELSRIANIILLFLVVEQFSARGSSPKPFVAAIGAAVLVPAAVAIAQLLSGEGLFVAGGFSRITGSFVHSNPLAYFSLIVVLLMVAILPAVRGVARFGASLVFVIGVVLLFLTYTRSAWLVAVVGVLILLWRRRSYAAMALIAAAVMLGAATPQIQGRFADLETAAQLSGKPANSLAWRWEYWQESLYLAEQSPVAGVGLRSVAATTTEGKQPHNDVIRSYVELGIPGLLSYLFVLGMALWTGIAAMADATRRRLTGMDRAIAEAGFVVGLAFVLLSFVANLMSQVVVTGYVMVILALASGAYLRRRRLDVDAEAASASSARLAGMART